MGIISFGRGMPFNKALFLVIAMAVSAIPEGLPAAMTVTLSLSAGVHVAMVTGDHPATAFAIARDLGIALAQKQVVVRKELADIGDVLKPRRLIASH